MRSFRKFKQNACKSVRHGLLCRCRIAFFLVFAVAFSCLPLYAQDGFFVEGAAQYCFSPQILKDLAKPGLGFRTALGYDYKNILLALESGFTHAAGTGPLIIDAQFIPLSFKPGYAFSTDWGLGLQANLNLGLMVSRVNHYYDGIHLIQGVSQTTVAASPLAGMRLYGIYTLPGNCLKIYAGGGFDAMFEKGGAVFLPLIEAGVSLKPLNISLPEKEKVIEKQARKAAREQIAVEEKSSTEKTEADVPVWETMTIPAAESIVFTHSTKNMVIQENEQGRTIRLLNAVYFQANSVNLLERYRPILNEAGERLKANPSLRITLRAYSAPVGTSDSQMAISAARAWYCMEYYMQRYGIPEQRMTIEYFGAQKSPEWIDASLESYRCVELIIE